MIKKILILSATIFFVLLPGRSVFALTAAQQQTLQTDSEYYDATQNPSCGGADSTNLDSSGLTQGSSVYIIGDDVTATAQSAYQAAFQQDGVTANIDAAVGRSLGSAPSGSTTGEQAITQDAATIKQASAIVIALGTSGGDTPTSIGQAIMAVRADNPAAPIYWIDTIVVGRPGYAATIQASNQAIYGQATTDGYTVLSWFKVVDPSGNPQQMTGTETDTNNYIDSSNASGVVPDAAGVTALVNLVVAPLVSGNIPSSSLSCSCTTVSLTGSTNAQEGYNFFTGKGLTGTQASGIIGNMQAESSIQPERLEGTTSGTLTPSSSLTASQLTDDTLGWGVVQWTPPGSVISPVKLSGGNPDDLGTQFSYVWQELNSNDLNTLTQLKTTTTPQAAADDFEQYFERPASLSDEPIREAFAEAFYQQFANGMALPPSLQSTATTGAGGCSSNPASATGTTSATGYKNPLRDVAGLSPERVDQGVDYAGTGPVYSLGDAIVISVATTNSGWPGLGTNCANGAPPCNGAFIKYKLTDGPAAGDYVYFAEDCRPTVTAGDNITSSTVICNMYEGGTNIETGWTTAAAGTQALASAQYQAGGGNSYATSAGQNFSALLTLLGAPAGIIEGNAGPNTLTGYPNWQ